jgi:hypothetical protein
MELSSSRRCRHKSDPDLFADMPTAVFLHSVRRGKAAARLWVASSVGCTGGLDNERDRGDGFHGWPKRSEIQDGMYRRRVGMLT